MCSRHLSALAACITLVVLCGPGVCLARPPAPPPGEFEETLRNPLRPRDDSRRVDRQAPTDTADAFRAGETDRAVVTDGKVPRVVLAQTDPVGFPRRGTWTGPETAADFPFTELVPSWNAITPKDTGVFFQVRLRDAASRTWSPWLFVGRGAGPSTPGPASASPTTESPGSRTGRSGPTCRSRC
jgi:hypothetical protein